MPFFSIIVPTYNSSSTVLDCIESVLNQSFIDFEILLIDGQSKDDTINKVEQLIDTRICILSEKDKGAYDAMNKGIDLARGEYLFFLGSDDRFFNRDVLSLIYKNIKEYESDIIYGNVVLLSNNGIYDGEFDRVKLSNEKNICHQSVFYHKNVFKRLGKYNLDFPIYADWDFNIRCFSTPDLQIKYIDVCIAYYNDRTGLSNSGNVDEKYSQLNNYLLLEQVSKQNKADLLIHRNNIFNSKEFKLGKVILYPLRKILRLLK